MGLAVVRSTENLVVELEREDWVRSPNAVRGIDESRS